MAIRAGGQAMDLKQKIVQLSCTQYAPFNDTHFTENLATEHGIRIARKKEERGRA